MILKTVQPWGKAPTPLLPKSILQVLGLIEAPNSVKDILGKQAILADLESVIWRHIDSVNKTCLAEIVDLVRRQVNSVGQVVIYSGQTLSQPIKTLPFSTRTRNVVLADASKLCVSYLKFQDILFVRSIGIRSAIEFSCLIEAAILDKTETAFDRNLQPKKIREEPAEFFPKEINSVFQFISAWAHGEKNLECLSYALPEPLPEWPEEIKVLWSDIGKISSKELSGNLIKNYSVPNLVSLCLVQIEERLIDIAINRIFAVSCAVTLEDLGKRLGVTRERVRQIEKKVHSALNETFLDKKFMPVKRRAESLRKRLGNAVLAEQQFFQDSLDWVVSDFNEEQFDKKISAELLLWLAGPYRLSKRWLLTDRNLPKKTIDAFLKLSDQRGFIERETAGRVLNDLGVIQRYHEIWTKDVGEFLPIDNGFIHFRGGMLDKAKALLRYYDRPMNAEEMMRFIGSGSIRSFRQRLIEDSDFWRINKQNEFVLADTEGYDEYTGITDEIIQEIELCGGQAHATHLIEKISRVYGVKEISILAYLNTPMFIKDEDGVVRVFDTENSVDISTDIDKSQACYFSSDEIWIWRIKIDEDIMRGSGRSIPNAFAKKLGCEAGEKIDLLTEFGTITLNWKLTSTTGAAIGSFRSVLRHFAINLGDYLFIKANKPNATFTFLKQEQVDAENLNLIKLALLLGCIHCSTEEEAIVGIATALGIDRETRNAVLTEARQKLVSKGETDIAELIQQPKLSVDEYLSEMSRLF